MRILDWVIPRWLYMAYSIDRYYRTLTYEHRGILDFSMIEAVRGRERIGTSGDALRKPLVLVQTDGLMGRRLPRRKSTRPSDRRNLKTDTNSSTLAQLH